MLTSGDHRLNSLGCERFTADVGNKVSVAVTVQVIIVVSSTSQGDDETRVSYILVALNVSVIRVSTGFS